MSLGVGPPHPAGGQNPNDDGLRENFLGAAELPLDQFGQLVLVWCHRAGGDARPEGIPAAAVHPWTTFRHGILEHVHIEGGLSRRSTRASQQV